MGLASSVICCAGYLGKNLDWKVDLLGSIGVTWMSKKQSQNTPIVDILPARSLQPHHTHEILGNLSAVTGLTKMSLIHSNFNGF